MSLIEQQIKAMITYAYDEWDETLLTYDNLKDIVAHVYKKGLSDGHSDGYRSGYAQGKKDGLLI